MSRDQVEPKLNQNFLDKICRDTYFSYQASFLKTNPFFFFELQLLNMMGMHSQHSCNRLTFKVAERNENGLKIHFGDILLLFEKSKPKQVKYLSCGKKK